MSLNVNGLAAWTDENKLDLITASILKGKTASLINVQPGIKNSASINILGSSLVAAAGACGWSATGATVLTQRDIQVCDIKINEAICLNTLEDYYTSKMMSAGSYNENIPFEQIFSEEKRDQIQALLEDITWRGDVAGGSGNLALCNGFIILLDTLTATTIDNAQFPSSGTVHTGTTGAMTAANAIAMVDTLIGLVPSDVIDATDLMMFMSYANYRTYATALRTLNLYAYTGAEGVNFEQFHPGTNVKVVAVRGLNGSNDIVLTPASNLYLGTDLLSDAESFKIWYSQDNDEVRFLSKFKFGVQVAFPQFVVHYQG